MAEHDTIPPEHTPVPSERWKESLGKLSVSLSGHIEVLVNDLQTRWQRGERVRIESLGNGYEHVAAQEEQLLDLIYHEILLREDFGERPTLDEYHARFPQHADRLQRLFAVHGAIESEWDHDPDASQERERPESSHDDPQRPASTDWSQTPGGNRSRWPRKRKQPMVVEAPPGYELFDELGRGGMAVVYRARQQILDRIVALKMILGGAIASPDVLARFEQEARTVAQLQHPGIVQIYEVGDHRGLPYLSLEFVPGGSLHDWLRGQPLAPMEAARLIEQLARTTHFAHERGVIHRDLKPANILLTERPKEISSDSTVISDSSVNDRSSGNEVRLKIADFGLARMLDSATNLTITGQLIGTPSYMAPEQARGAVNETSPALDVYSLGAILFELLTGHPPFRGATIVDTLDQVRNEEPVSPRRLQPRVPADLETICLKCLEKAPERRYATALALADDLRSFQNGEAIAARPVRAAERAWKWMQRSPAIASLTATAVLFAVVGIVGTLVETARANKNADDARADRDRALLMSGIANAERATAEQQRLLAEVEKARAVEAQAETERQRQSAEQEKAIAVAARAQADASFKNAMQAVVSLTNLGRQLRNEPRQQATSRRIFDEALPFYESFLSVRGEDKAVRYFIILAFHEAAGIRSDMGERDKARELLNRSADLLASLLKDHPNSVRLLHDAAQNDWMRGNLLRGMSKSAEADEAYLACIARHDALLALNTGDRLARVRKANAIVNRCVVLQQLGRKADALDQYAVATGILRDLARTNPKDEHARTELALCLDDYGNALYGQGRRNEAEVLLREALDVREQIYQRNSTDHSGRIFLARSLTAVGRCELADDDFQAAKAKLQRAAGLLEPFLKDYPEVYQYYAELYSVYLEQFRVAVRQKGFLGVATEWQKLQEFIARAHAKFPEDQFFSEWHGQGQARLGALWWESPDGQSVLRLGRELAPVFDKTSNVDDERPADAAAVAAPQE